MLEKLDYTNFVKYDSKKEKGKITELKITQIDLPLMVEELYPLVDPKNNLKNNMILFQYNLLGQDQKLLLASQMLITRYCLHRILTHFKVYQPENWTYQLGEDYFGQEIQGLMLKSICQKKIEQQLEELRSKNNTEKIEMILKLEYGRLIPSVTNQQWSVIRVDPNELHYSNDEHQLQCKTDLGQPEFTKYAQILREYPYPRGLAILDPVTKKYKIIDGYHRLIGSPSDEEPLIIKGMDVAY